ncbi:unnamed protein product [Pseudo-nitzschia multistriata]|uniref:Uncharacterized protein n=1 Tax=Pseudo-nitzschia multistriata TaxID=183589 RepID=A0A448ZC93_9STRA|nr:unnamed protein product [Pseudo-nitzschia multistriata]
MITKKFTRGSLKRASSSGISLANDSEDPSKAEIIQLKTARARSKSMQNRNAMNQQHRRHRSLSRDPQSRQPSADIGGQTIRNYSHPNDTYNQAFNEAELQTAMSSLTEPTWAPSDLGRSDVKPTHHRQNQQMQRSRTGNYNNVRYTSRPQYKKKLNRATVTISTGKDQKETKILLLDNNDTRKSQEGIEASPIDPDEERNDEADDKTTTTGLDHLPTKPKAIRSSDLRDGVSSRDDAPSTPKHDASSSRARSKTRRAGDQSSVSKTRGRSGRPSSDRKSLRRSSSVASRRSAHSTRTGSTAPTVPTSSTASSQSRISRTKSKIRGVSTRKKVNDNKSKSSTSRSSSVPPTMSDSKRKQRTLSVPPLDQKKSDRKNDNNEFMDAILDTSEIVEDPAVMSVRSKSQFHPPSFRSLVESPFDCRPTPSSAVEAARMSLRPRLRRSSSNRSVSSIQSESIISMMSTASRRQTEISGGNLQESHRSPQIIPASPSNSRYGSRSHKLAKDVHSKRIHERRQKKREEHEKERKRRQQKNEEKKQRKEARASALTNETDTEEPQYTTINTLLYDFLVFNLLLVLSFPQYLVSFLWSRTFSKQWSARRKTVVVTGARSPLAAETARQYAAQGANLILISHSSTSVEDDLDWLVEECHQLGSSNVRSYSADLSKADSAEQTLQQAAEDFNETFDVVILNGENKSHGCLFEEIIDVHEIEDMVKGNTIGCLTTLHYALKHIPKTSDSRIVILSSTSGLIASPYKSVYGATQHALKGFCDSIRMELNSNYTERRAPKICYASFPELIGKNIHHQNCNIHISRMGAENPPMKTHSWAAIPLQKAVHDLLEAVALGERDYGSPRHVKAWRCFQAIAPRWADFSILRHVQKTQCRSVEKDINEKQRK